MPLMPQVGVYIKFYCIRPHSDGITLRFRRREGCGKLIFPVYLPSPTSDPQSSPHQITGKAVEVGGPEAELYTQVGPEEEEEAGMK